MKIAIIGSGISGLATAYLLSRRHEITLFEAASRLGGHTHTHRIQDPAGEQAIDTGFIVFNDWTYPNFIKLIDRLGVESQASSMSFSVKSEPAGLEYNGTSLNGLFAQRGNLLSPPFHRMIRDILRFNREAAHIASNGATPLSLGDFLARGGYSRYFIDHYIVPMGAAIWSAAPGRMHDFPIREFARFFKNHGMLNVNDRPTWRVIKGGSSNYIPPLIANFRSSIRLQTPIESVRRAGDHVLVKPAGAEPERFDWVVLAAHSDQALRVLADPSDDERRVLGAIRYQPNATALHTDASILPRRRRAWASWNYLVPREEQDSVAVTYNMNILQSLKTARTYCVSLNCDGRIAPQSVLQQMRYEHPVYDAAAFEAQTRRGAISGVNRTSYCGAYWGDGFHEDGVKSALAVGEFFGESL